MDIKLVALDIDGTLFDSHGLISERTVNAIKKCTDKGIYVVFSTGRDYEALPLLQVEGSGMQYAITTNGSALYELGTRKCLWENTMTTEDIELVLKYSDDRDIFPFLFIDGRGYAKKDDYGIFERVAWPEHLKTETRKSMNLVDDLEALVRNSDRGVQKGAILFPSLTEANEDEDHAVISGESGINPEGNLFARSVIETENNRKKNNKGYQSIQVENKVNPAGSRLTGWDETSAYLNNIPGIHAVDGGCDNLEFNRSDTTKASGLRQLCHLLKVPVEATLAIGDSENDLEVLKAAGTGIAMANAPAEVKAHADHVTTSNDDDGVARVLERLVD